MNFQGGEITTGTRNPILHVEDDESDILFFQRALSATGSAHAVKVVRNGIEAMNYLLGHPPFQRREQNPAPSLIIMDLHLPLLNGLEFLNWRQTRPEFQHIPVLMLSSTDDPADITAAYEAGANGYLVKPPSYTGLLEIAKAIQFFWLTHNTFVEPRPRLSQFPASALDTLEKIKASRAA